MDPRLRRAIDANVAWYNDIFALHGIASRLEHGLWRSLAAPPPLHSDAVVVEPGVPLDRVMAVLAGRHHAGFKDSFSVLDASGSGMEVLFSATWIHRAAVRRAGSPPPDWSILATAAELAEWTAGHDTTEVLIPSVLDRAQVAVLARRLDGDIVAGAVARLGTGVVDVSNVHAAPGQAVDWTELVSAIDARFPRRDIVGYERGDDLEAALAAGFEPVGELRVWVR
jgi:hypothetical protein